MSQVSSLFSKNKFVYASAFIMPVVILAIILICSEVYPLGDQCILRIDLYHQYAPFLSELREKLQNGGSLKFTWDLGLGVNFVAIMAYYLASPLNAALIFVNENHVIEFIMAAIVIKCGLSGMAMAAYLKYRSPENGFGACMLSLFYSLGGFYCAYYWNLMWLDTVALFPLMVLGMEKLLRGESGVLYAAMLGLGIFTNYYISIMVCIFLALYFFIYGAAYGFGGAKGFLKKGVRFAAWSLVAGGLAAVMLIPEIRAFTQTASADGNFPSNATEYFSIIRVLSRHMPGVETEQWLDHNPNIYCGAAVYMVFILYAMSKRIPLREKSAYFAAVLIFMASFSINVLNYIWHGFKFPNSLPARQSFIYIFLMVAMSFRVYADRDFIDRRGLAASLSCAVAFTLVAQEITHDDEQFHFMVYYSTIILLALYAWLIYAYRNSLISGALSGLFFAVMVIAEVSSNAAVTSMTTTSRTAYTGDNVAVRELVSEIREKDFGLYRFEKKSRKTKDDGAWMNFPSVSIFSSMANADCTALYKRLGCEASTNAYSITGSTPLVDMLLGIKYSIYSNDPTGGEYTGELMGSRDNIWVCRNLYSLPVGILLPESLTENWMEGLTEPAILQNSICDLLGTEQVLKPVTTLDGTGSSASVTISEAGEYYAYVKNVSADTVTVNWPEKKKTFEHLDRGYFIELGELEPGELIKFSSDDGKNMDLQLYRFDYDALSQLYGVLSGGTLDITSYGDDYINGTVTVDSGSLGYTGGRARLMLSTPYDEGWKVKVDGKPVTVYKSLDALLSFYVEDGTHEVELSYDPPGLKEGMAVSAICLVILAGFAAVNVYKRRKAAA